MFETEKLPSVAVVMYGPTESVETLGEEVFRSGMLADPYPAVLAAKR
jgi:hypothetical protein